MGLEIQVQSPTVELLVESTDGSGSSSSILVGFKRYTSDVGADRLEDYHKIVRSPDFEVATSGELAEFLKAEVRYIKNITTSTYNSETDKTTKLKISDTRKAQKLDGLWETPDECLDVLLDGYLKFTSWRLPLVTCVQSAMLDMNIAEGRVKNY